MASFVYGAADVIARVGEGLLESGLLGHSASAHSELDVGHFGSYGVVAHLSAHHPPHHKHQYHPHPIIISMHKWVILLFLLSVVLAEDQGDWVDPNLLPVEFPIKPFFAGYLDIHAGKALFYVYTPSLDNPSKDPLVVLLSPGPGCSSLHNWLYSKGEFVFVRGQQTFRYNDHSWNRQANVLYIQGPAGTGFSYGAEDNVTDEITQKQYFRALLRFYGKFPQLKDQKMYLSGFGYAGIIVPKLAVNIIEHNRDPDTSAWLRLNLNGILLFNPCTYAEECDSHFDFNHFTVRALRNNYFIDKKTFEDFESQCTMRTPGCEAVEQKIESDFRISGADLRNLFMECLHQPGDYGCIDHVGIDIFMNVQAVKEDLHAKTSIKWDLCNFTLSKEYQRDPDGSLKTYETLLREEHNLRIWIVSGTQSAVVPTFGTKRWVDELKMNMRRPTVRPWQPWFYNNINAGEVESMPGLQLITIRSAGYHMFEDQPELSNHIYTSFLKGQNLV